MEIESVMENVFVSPYLKKISLIKHAQNNVTLNDTQ